MANLKQIKSRIRSIENTGKITRAMEMVSIAKLRQIEGVLVGQRQYYRRMEGMLGALIGDKAGAGNVLLKSRKPGDILLCVVTSDTGLCGTYNGAVIRNAEEFIRSRTQAGARVKLALVGKRGFAYFRKRGYDIVHSYLGSNGRYNRPAVEDCAKRLTQLFVDAKADEVHVCHMHYESLSRYRPLTTQLLPLEPPAQTGKNKLAGFIIEPDAERLAAEFFPAFVRAKMRLLVVESFVAEHGCRMVAMKMASDNARELKDALVLIRNKARQAAITKEVIEIISASGGH